MSLNIRVGLEGERKLLRKLDKLDASLRGKIMSEAVKKGALVLRREARRRAPRRRGAGSLKGWKQIRLKRTSKLSARSERVEYAVSWRVGTASRTPAFYLLFAEKGTAKRTRKNVGGKFKGSQKKGTGRQSAKPFLIPAFDRKKDEAGRVVKKELLAQIAKVARGG